jgi:predicted amidohydrolase
MVIVAGVQMDCRFGEKEANLGTMERRAREAAGRGARLVVFPECALTGYCAEEAAEARSLAEPVPGPATDAMARLCRELGIFTIFGLIEEEGDGFFNSLAFIGPEGLAGETYRKIHLPFLGLDRFSTPGDRPFQVRVTPLGRIGLNICYDAGFPESSRVLALQGADLIVLPTNWPEGAIGLAEHAIITRALENHVFYLAVNRVGEERGFKFIGRSRLVDPAGRTIFLGSPDREELLISGIEPALSRRKRIEHIPGKYVIDRIGDRRPEFYGSIGGGGVS